MLSAFSRTLLDNPSEPPITKVILLSPLMPKPSRYRASSFEDIASPQIARAIAKESSLIFFKSSSPSFSMSSYSFVSVTVTLAYLESLLRYSFSASFKYFSFKLPAHSMVIFIALLYLFCRNSHIGARFLYISYHYTSCSYNAAFCNLNIIY